jgi:MoaA/NifB/PqqE/SkfB family radical SAM enzyme
MHNLDLELVGSQLKDVWIEVSQSCNHRCRNCFQATEKGIDGDPDNLTDEQLLDIVNQAIEMGANEIGIPGAGEPFHPKNVKTLFRIIDNNFKKHVHTTIFTHLGFFDERLVKRLDKYGDRITLLAKFNTFRTGVQDWFDDAKGYGKKRNEILELLFKYGFNDGKRLGFVTSVMTFNHDEIPEIFRYCRRNNIIVDFDPLLPRGRGANSPLNPTGEKLKAMYELISKIDREEFGNDWEPTCNYIGPYACNRYKHHIYVTKTGNVHPCIGSVHVILGNAKKKKLKDIWDSAEMKIIHSREYDGKCLDCALFIGDKCNCCLGRYTQNLSNKNLLRTGKVHTIGCWGFKEKSRRPQINNYLS